jgi:hypothetical protein
MPCTVAQRERVRDAAAALDTHPAVLAPSTIEPGADPTNAWTLEFLIDEGYRGVPSAVLRDLADHDLAIRTVAHRHVVAIAES